MIEKKLPDLLSLLESHARDATPEVVVVPRPPTPIPPPPIQTERADKKRKKDNKGGKGSTEEREIQEETPLEQSKATKVTRAQQRRGGETLEMNSERRTRIPNWNPPFVLDAATLPIDSSICNFENERAGSVANSVKQTLRLPQDMAELCNLKKHEMFLSLKRDLALVQFCIILLLFFNSHFLYACKFSSHSSSTCHRGMG